jgi:hypothetical protein
MDLALVAARVPAMMREMNRARADINRMRLEGRDPTEEEIKSVMDRLQNASDRLMR